MATCFRLIVFAVLASSSLYGQCAIAYADGALSSDGTTVYAWSVLTDSFTDYYNYSCRMTTQNFTHYYTSDVGLTSPSGRVAYNQGGGSQTLGAPGYSRTDTNLSVGTDYGTYYISGYKSIYCTVISAVFFTAVLTALVQAAHPVLTCNTQQVARAGTVNCSVSGVSPGQVARWWFSPSAGGLPAVNGPSGTTSWGGTMVASGTISVTIASFGDFRKAVTVNSRTGFRSNAVAAAKRPNPYVGGQCNISVPTAPQANNNIGYYCLDQYYSYTPATVSGGPNANYRYVASASLNTGQAQTAFNYIIAGYLDDANSEFSRKQCGNYNPGTNTGFIAYAQLKSNTYEHESGVLGHYARYKTAQDDSAHNLGLGLEPVIAAPGTSDQDFDTQIRSAALPRLQAIRDITTVEDCNHDVRLDTTCTFRGYINWPTYTNCPQ